MRIPPRYNLPKIRHRFGLLWIFVIYSGLTLFAACASVDSIAKANLSPATMFNPPAVRRTIDIGQFAKESDKLYVEFSDDSQYIAVLNWLPYSNEFQPIKPKREVFDLSGRRVPLAVDTEGYFTPEFETKFDVTALRRSSDLYNPYIEGSGAVPAQDALPYGPIFSDAKEWTFDRSFSKCIIHKSTLSGAQTSQRLEMWRLKPQALRLWSVELNPACPRWKCADFIFAGTDELIAIHWASTHANDSAVAYVVSNGDRAPRSERLFEELEGARENVRYEDPIDINARLNLFAFGSADTGTVRLDSTDKSNRDLSYSLKVVDIVDSSDQMYWSMPRLKMVNNYLVVDLFFGVRGRLIGRRSKYITSIYDLNSRALLWAKDDASIKSATISPNGKNLAFIAKRKVYISSYPGVL